MMYATVPQAQAVTATDLPFMGRYQWRDPLRRWRRHGIVPAVLADPSYQSSWSAAV